METPQSCLPPRLACAERRGSAALPSTRAHPRPLERVRVDVCPPHTRKAIAATVAAFPELRAESFAVSAQAHAPLLA